MLKADVLLPEITERFGDYGPIYKRLLLAGASHIDFPERNLEIKDYDVIENPVYPKLEDVDAIVISGSSEYLICFILLSLFLSFHGCALSANGRLQQ